MKNHISKMKQAIIQRFTKCKKENMSNIFTFYLENFVYICRQSNEI